MTPRPWQVLATRTVHQDRWLTLAAERVQTGTGHVLDPFYVVTTASWACTVPLLPDGRVVCVRQYRHGIGRVVTELPAGMLDPRETPAQAAVRELAEETGYRAVDQPVPLGELWPEPARSRMSAHGFLVRVDPLPMAAACEASEDIEVVAVPFAELLADGAVMHAVHVAFLHRAWALCGS
jgi:8-oxo-dGTP pyrophosphatase MutT (NUDIX family)